MVRIFLYLLILIFPVTVFAADAGNVVAVVNDDIVSDYDVYNRAKMVILTSKIPDNEEALASLRPQVIETLINERIKVQIAKDNGITVSDKEINSVIAGIERQGGMGNGLFRTFLTMNHVDPETIDSYVSADLMWQKYVAQRFSAEGKVSDAELEAELNRIKDSFKKDRVLVLEIFMPVKKGTDEKAVFDKITKVYRELKDGADFSVLADTFSESVISGKGGNLGWINKGILEEKLDKVIFSLDVDDISEPIRGNAGYYLFTVKDKRKAYDGVENLYSVSRVVYSIADEPEVSAILQKLPHTSCDEFNNYAYSLKNESGEMVVSKIDDFPDEFVEKINNMKQFDMSSPFEYDDKMNVVMLCNVEKKYPLPDLEKVRHSLASSRLERVATRFFEELKDTSVIKLKQ